ncbi:hypothetical protein MIND_00081300 [Mycena indigotica]|uniref:Rpr2-domain-containing protein n=1 Tax=Mycena indigotica TaxID=2126181 RepID=A0A8H6TFB5_9AGAR|nr:uncharacterized protein MIND_00081300 [Mycena indigotica]KAF7315657.1 hypothetical protein MIND_00081300 [Mycena indigotica]
MAKKSKDEPLNPNNITNRDIMQRLNFMYQASVYLGTVLPVPPPSTPPRRAKRSRRMNVHDLSKVYAGSMKTVSKKTMVKIDPSVKRTICQGCNLVLLAGSTASVRVNSSREHGHVMSYRCIACDSTRRIPAPPTFMASPNTESETQIDPTTKIKPRPPPLFARDVGHVVFRGNEQLSSTMA